VISDKHTGRDMMRFQKDSYRSIFVYSFIFLFITVNQLPHVQAPEFQVTQWSVPQKIPLYYHDMSPPILIADQNRIVHAFSSQWIVNDDNNPFRAVVYNQWSLDQGWTVPTDIILSPDNKEARLTDAYLDKNGIFHVIFFGGDNTGADIYYSNAPLAYAENARAWSVPILIGEDAGDPEGAVFVEDEQGTLHVIYNGRQLGNGLYTVKSTDGGKNWSGPITIFFNLTDEPNTAQLQAFQGTSGKLHVVWGVYNAAGQGRGIYYSSSEDGSGWSSPILLADAEEGLGTEKPTIIEYNQKLFVLYILTPKITMRLSKDDGKSWDNPLIIFPRHIGVNGELSMVIDSNHELHLFFGQRIPGGPDIHGMWHSRFINNRWIEPESLIKGPRVVDRSGDKGFDPNFARAVVSQGNVILVTWRTDPGAGANGIWYSYKKIAAPELPIAVYPTLADFNGDFDIVDAPSTVSSLTASTPTITTTETENTRQTPAVRSKLQNDPSLPIIIGSITAIVAIVLVTIIFGLARSK
jgi:hypothetical protein